LKTYTEEKEINGKRYEIIERLGGHSVDGAIGFFVIVKTNYGERVAVNFIYPQNQWNFWGDREKFKNLIISGTVKNVPEKN